MVQSTRTRVWMNTINTNITLLHQINLQYFGYFTFSRLKKKKSTFDSTYKPFWVTQNQKTYVSWFTSIPSTFSNPPFFFSILRSSSDVSLTESSENFKIKEKFLLFCPLKSRCIILTKHVSSGTIRNQLSRYTFSFLDSDIPFSSFN